jgi:hypothetical protein
LKIELSRKQVKLTVLFLCTILISSLGGYAYAQSGASPDIYLDDLPSQVTYTIKTDGTNYWAVRHDGYIAFESTNLTLVQQQAATALIGTGGIIQLNNVVFNPLVSLSANVTVQQNVYGQQTVTYSNTQVVNNGLTSIFGIALQTSADTIMYF